MTTRAIIINNAETDPQPVDCFALPDEMMIIFNQGKCYLMMRAFGAAIICIQSMQSFAKSRQN